MNDCYLCAYREHRYDSQTTVYVCNCGYETCSLAHMDIHTGGRRWE